MVCFYRLCIKIYTTKKNRECREIYLTVVTLESGKQRIIQLRVSKKVYNIMSEYLGENVMEYNIKQRKLFSSIYRDIKRKFGVASYKDIKVVEYEKALNFIENWIEDKEVI